tara:strand:- start:1475 stop:1642 length:168 start_codon:yes stop_codon:yes gene_type:complete
MRSVVALKEIREGEVFTEKNITTKRPFLPGNIHSSEYYSLIGHSATKDYEQDDFI